MSKNYKFYEEVGNSITHGIGVFLGVIGLMFLIVFAHQEGTTMHVISFSVFGATLILLYLISTLYHAFSDLKLKKLFQKLDHIAIFLLIAGTYTPICLTVLTGSWRWTILSMVWGGALLGILLKVFFTGKLKILSTVIYALLGLIVIVAIKQVYSSMTMEGFVLLVLGGVFYLGGIYFYLRDQIKFFHVIWHLFVLAGSTFHYFAVFSLLPN